MFLETICIDHGSALNLEGHISRMQHTAAHFHFKALTLPETLLDISFEKYQPKRVESLQLVEASPDYFFKYADRKEMSRLLEQKGAADEILITCNGIITDTTFSNVAFCQGYQLFTPDSYLLNGTKRQQLLRQGVITERRISRETLHEYESVCLINAMLDVGDTIPVPISSIIP